MVSGPQGEPGFLAAEPRKATGAVDLPIRRSGATIESPLVEELARYWSGCRGERPFPARSDLDPLDIPDLLPNLLLLDVLAAGSYRVRLFGTLLAAGNLNDLTGRSLEDCGLGRSYASFRDLFDEVCATGQPIFFESGFYWQRQEHRPFKMGVFPLGPEPEAVDILLGGVDILPASNPRGFPAAGRQSLKSAAFRPERMVAKRKPSHLA